MGHKSLKVHKTTESHKNLKVKVPINRSLGSRNQTMDSSNKRCLSGLHNKKNGIKKELV